MIIQNKNLIVKFHLNPFEIKGIIAKKSQHQFLYQQDFSWKKTWPTLFPITGGLINNSYCYQKQHYQMNKHGFFAKIKNWKILAKKDSLITFYFEHKKEFWKIFPFYFKIIITLKVIKFKLKYQVKIINCDHKKIYFGFGFHPAFKLKNFTNSYLKTNSWLDLFEIKENNQIVKISKQKLKTISLNNLDFKASNTYLLKNNIKKILFYNQDYKLKLSWTNCLYFLIWTKSKQDQFLCLEPWNGFLDNITNSKLDLDHKKGLISLKPKKNKKFNLTLKLFDYIVQ